MKAIQGILLAAGASRRFGADKLLHPLDGAGGKLPLAARSAGTLLEVLPGSLAVVRPGSPALQQVLAGAGCVVTQCPRANEGMGHSLAHAIAASPAAQGWIVALADMPCIRADSIRAVLQALQDGALIAVPVHRGERGHPVGFSAGLREELLALSGDQGARGVLQRHAGAVRRVLVDDPGVIRDIDTPADLPPAGEAL